MTNETVQEIQKQGGLVHKEYALNLLDKAIDRENRTVKFTITTEGVDRDNDTVAKDGWEVQSYLKNPSVLWAHDYTQLPVAKALDITKTTAGLESTAQFPPVGTYPFADTVFELLAGGFLNATSVGFRPIDYTQNVERGGLDFKKQELLEYSIVPVPSNPGALIMARTKGINVSLITEWARKALTAIKGMCPDCGCEYDGQEPKCGKCMSKDADIAAIIEKIGRVLSAANESRLRDAREKLDTVLSQLESEPVEEIEEKRRKGDNPFPPKDEDEEEDEKPADDEKPEEEEEEKFADDAVVIHLISDDVVSREEIEAALSGGVRAALATLVRDEVGVALSRARGRID